MKQPEFVRGARFSSHAHRWEYTTGVAYVDFSNWRLYPSGLIYGAIVWRKRRRVPHGI